MIPSSLASSSRLALKSGPEKFRLLVGEEAASKSGQFTFLNCFDGGSGTLACLVKESVKLYVYNIRSLHVESRRNKAIETALADAVAQGMTAQDAAKQRFGRFGYLVGSQLGSWVGGRIGLMVYDVVNGIHYLMQSMQEETQVYEDGSNDKVFQRDDHENSEVAEESYMDRSTFGSNSDEFNNYGTPADESFGSAWSSDSHESSNYETPTDERFHVRDEL
ncbi:hypothetical protein DH2020_003188 [Rehmannia glutinosa]|uniref:Uncharacterized protein n=1 Tax=Rehmannia glutinosa TaxID=99300 RepID=A0ABR0XKW0_REHGL